MGRDYRDYRGKIGSYEGRDVVAVDKSEFEMKKSNEKSIVYAVMSEYASKIPLVNAGRIIGYMSPQGNVEDCRPIAYPFKDKKKASAANYEKRKPTETEVAVHLASGTAEIDFGVLSAGIDAFLAWSQKVDYAKENWADTMPTGAKG